MRQYRRPPNKIEWRGADPTEPVEPPEADPMWTDDGESWEDREFDGWRKGVIVWAAVVLTAILIAVLVL